nr:MAG: nonstructural protein [Eriocheir sinensis dicistro-like virus]
MATTKVNNVSESSKTVHSAPQKFYNGQNDQAQKRKILRTHLFSGRLFKLASLYEGKPLPLFEKSTHLFNQSINFHGRRFTIKLSRDDMWTDAYTTKLRRFEEMLRDDNQEFQSLSESMIGLALGGLGFTTSILKTAAGGFTRSLMTSLTSSVSAIGILLKSSDTFVCVQAMTILITNLGMSMDIFSRIAWPLATGGMVWQAGESFSWIPSAVAVTLIMLMGVTNAGQFFGIFTKSAALGYTMSTIVGSHRIMSEALKELVPFIYNLVTGREWLGETILSNFATYQDFIKQVDLFEATKLKDLDINASYQQEVFDMVAMHRALLEESDRLRLRTSLTPLLSGYQRKLAEWVKLVQASGLLLAGVRQEPLVIMLSGSPGIGKSYIVQQLVKDIGASLIPWTFVEGETISNHIYQRNVSVAHWDGYKQQFCTLYDDFMQVVDSVGKPNPEVAEMIQAAGCNAFHLPMAELSEKKQGYFRSQLIVATSNLSQFTSSVVKSVIAPSALERRFDFHIRLTKRAGKVIFTPMLDGAEDHEVTYDVLVALARAKMDHYNQKFVKRIRESQDRTSSIPNHCVARLLHLTSAPSTTLNTAMVRRVSDSNSLDHSYCHSSLPCRQSHEGIWNWIWGTSESEPDQYRRDVSYGQYLWDGAVRSYTTPWSEDDANRIILCHAELDQALEGTVWEAHYDTICNDPTIRGREAVVSYDKVELFRFLNTHHRDLILTTISRKADRVHLNMLDACMRESTEDMTIEGFVAPATQIAAYANKLWELLKRSLSFLSGPFARAYQTLCQFTMDHPFLVGPCIYIACCGFGLALEALKTGFKLFTRSEEDEKAMKAMLETYLQSRSDFGAQKSREGTRYTFESRDEKGGQRTHAATRMRYEAEPFDCLEVASIGNSVYSIEYVTVKQHLLFDLIDKKPGSAAMWKRGMSQYTELAILTCEVNTEVRRDNIASEMRRVYQIMCDMGAPKAQVAEAMGAKKDIVDVLKKMAGTKLESDVFESVKSEFEVPKNQKFEGSADQNADGISKKISSSLCDIARYGGQRVAQVWFYAGRRCWVNKHTMAIIGDARKITLTRYNKAGPVETHFDIEDIEQIAHPSLDIVILQFPVTFSPFPVNRDLIATDADMNFSYVPGGRLVTRREGSLCFLNSGRVKRLDTCYATPSGDQEAFTGLAYDNMHSDFGDCGAPFVVIDKTRDRKIMGFHMMGNSSGAGTTVIVTQELLADLERASKFEAELTIARQEFQDSQCYDAVLAPVAVIKTPFEPTKTKVRRSVIHGAVTTPTTRPSILRPYDDFDPMHRGLKAMQHSRPNIPMSFVRSAADVMSRYISGTPVIARVLTLEEALSGKNIPGVEPMDRSTSAGLPLCLDPMAKGKKKWISETYEPTPELVKLVSDFEAELSTGHLSVPPVFKATLKDERVKLEKADLSVPEKVKTRLFAASPMVLSIVLRKYFGAFFGHLVENRTRNTCTTGVNPMGSDWQQMADFLHEVSPLVNDGDYSTFDVDQPSGFLLVPLKAAIFWYKINGATSFETQMREYLITLIIHAHVSAKGTVFRLEGTLPSGVFGTTAINSGVNLTAFYYAFRSINPMASSLDFLQDVRTLTHGDDVIFSVSERQPLFTAARIGVALKEAGMTFTPALKGDTMFEARPIEEITFLKRSFKKIGGMYRAPLATESSMEMCNWITKTNDPIVATEDNIKAAFRELAISEDDYSLQEALQQAFYSKTSILIPLVRREELLCEFTKHF